MLFSYSINGRLITAKSIQGGYYEVTLHFKTHPVIFERVTAAQLYKITGDEVAKEPLKFKPLIIKKSIRPREIQCKTCSGMVFVSRFGRVPDYCKIHRFINYRRNKSA